MSIVATPSGGWHKIEAKRCYLPIVLEGKCPGCGADWKRDFRQDYISYPLVNVEDELGCHCGACDHEWRVTVVLRVSFDIVPAEVPTP